MRLNPFAFPSDTTFRFALFIAAIVGVSLLAFDWLYGETTDLRREALALLDCSRRFGMAPGQVATDEQLAALRSCTAAVNETRRAAMLLGVVVLLAGGVVAVAIAFARNRRRYRPLADATAPAVTRAVRDLAKELGVDPPPALRWRPLDGRALGLAFGPPTRRELGFTGGLVPLLVRDPGAFRAIVLHELAHLRNGDVDLSYLAVGIWRSLVVVALVPFVVVVLLLSVSDPATILALGWRLLALVPLVYLIRSSILRAREHDADVRASTLEPGIRRVLAATTEPPLPRWRRVLRWHPSPEQRVAVIDDPTPLLRLGLADAFSVGIVGSLAYEEVATLVGYFPLESFVVRGVPALLFGSLVGLVLALGVFRQTFASLATGRGSVRTVYLGLALTAGLFVGQRLSLVSAIYDEAVLLRPDPRPFHLIVGAGIAVAAIAFARWLVAASRCWLPVATRLGSPGRAAAPVAIGAAVVVAVAAAVFQILVASRELIELLVAFPDSLYAAVTPVVPAVGPEWLWRLVLGPEVRIVVEEPLVLIGFLVLVLLPWSALPFSRTLLPRPVAAWGALDPDSPPPAVPRPDLRARRTVVIGLLVGAGIAIALLILHAFLRASFDAATRDRDEFLLAFAFWLLVTTLVGQVVAGGIGALGAVHLPASHGALAGLVAGLVGTAAGALDRAFTSCVAVTTVVEGRPCGRPPTLDYLFSYAATTLTVGILGAVLAAAAVGLARALVAGRGEPAPATPAPAG